MRCGGELGVGMAPTTTELGRVLERQLHGRACDVGCAILISCGKISYPYRNRQWVGSGRTVDRNGRGDRR